MDERLEAVSKEMGLHPEEANPRGETWLHERRNWETEVRNLRNRVSYLENELDKITEDLRVAREITADVCLARDKETWNLRE